MKSGIRSFTKLLGIVTIASIFAGGAFRVLASCAGYGLPFTDLGSETTFCAAIAEAYFSGLANGTSATTYNPSGKVPRDQMAAFITRTLDQALLRGSRRAALGQRWTSTPHYDKSGLGTTDIGAHPFLLKSDGADVWVTSNASGTVTRVRASDGKSLQTWNSATNAYGVLVAMGKVFVAGNGNPGHLYMIDPTASPGAVTTVATLGIGSGSVAFDGDRIWTVNAASISIVTPGSTTPWSVSTISTGFAQPVGILFDGNNVWVTDNGSGDLFRLDSSGTILQTIPIGTSGFPAFDGHDIWIPDPFTASLTVVRASDGAILKKFSDANGDRNGLFDPEAAAFDGQRILVTNGTGSVSLFKAADLSIIGNFPTPGMSALVGVCSDRIRFWVADEGGTAIGAF